MTWCEANWDSGHSEFRQYLLVFSSLGVNVIGCE